MKTIASLLAKNNAVFLGRKTFLDTSCYSPILMCRYYDFGDKKLTLQNIWLRKRQNTWELKTGNNPKSDPNAVVGPVTTYYMWTLWGDLTQRA
jgi:singapore isolate B (sub-type 7) whole genome shotgun sequence assembly, scaffold_3